ncbi:DNA polymerase subunit gamma-1, mitochondrial [Cylas formicarius]|uniref:DNA polymerase subunit gamma-1, mitochondrial n=1 Tax=Cylas formicarius TaxID=197179 RepID=UPI002958385C|nr:DNA polymerase subunit gamma-1, mitochondrial [Cylas formicarius]
MIDLKGFSYKQFLLKLGTWSQYRRTISLMPKSRKKIFAPNPNKRKLVIEKALPNAPTFVKELGPRKNKLGIQMLSKFIYDQVFLEDYREKCSDQVLNESRQELLKHNMSCKNVEIQEDVNFKIPPLYGRNIEEHFYKIGEQQLKPYRDLMNDLVETIPQIPKKWLFCQGWTRYAPNSLPEKVDFPLERALVFDVEVCMVAGKLPTLATAVSSKAWYSWVSPALINGSSKADALHHYTLSELISFESTSHDDGSILNDFQKEPKVIIGHNISYDRARIKEQYWLNKTGTRFVDTMSLHVCVSGLTSYQRAVIKSDKFLEEDESWKNCSSLNNLIDVYKLYCNKKLNKETRDIFVTGTLTDIMQDFQKVMRYCSTDVLATYEIFQKLYPLFLERFPHPVTLAGMMELGTAYLPVNQNWNTYISESEQTFQDLEAESRILLARHADNACQLLHDNKYQEDLWLWDQDWDTKSLRLKKLPEQKKNKCESKSINSETHTDEDVDELEEKFKYLWKTKESLSSVQVLLPGYPNWYRKICTKSGSTPDWIPGPHLISTSMKITPKLLHLTWEGYPLHHVKERGWGFLVPYSDDCEVKRSLPLKQLLEKCPLLTEKSKTADGDVVLSNITKAVEDHLMSKEYYSKVKKDKTGGLYKGAGVWCNIQVEDCCWFFKLPHKDGASYNVGNPLAKDFLNKFSENVLASDSKSAENVLTIARKLSYWRNNRNRILDQMVVWLPEDSFQNHLQHKGFTYGAIIPQVVVCGTLTRRAMEPTWMTASNAHCERIGSELRAMVQAPPGYYIVGADVDSQELWIASVLGDSHHAKMHGATPFGWMTLSGNKSNETDMHSVTAKGVGISRDHAKVINYARIYGAGQNFAERLLKQFNPSMSETEARSKALKMFTLTKGKKIYYLKPEHLLDFPDKPYNQWQAFEIAKSCRKTIDEMFLKSKWVGGTESAMFNRLEEIANSPSPCTPFLGGRLTRALEPKTAAEDKYLPTRVNWVVQSGAVDFLHLMLVCMKWIMGGKVRFCISFHDEVRYLVPEQYKYQAALALHVTNLLTRSFCCYRLGLADVPQSVAFFSSVEVDTVLRKECGNDCQTPSNPHGLEKGYGIKSGESLDIYQAINKAAGAHTCWYDDKKIKEFEEKCQGQRKGST